MPELYLTALKLGICAQCYNTIESFKIFETIVFPLLHLLLNFVLGLASSFPFKTSLLSTYFYDYGPDLRI